MGAPFTPLPPEAFPKEARPHIARLNRFLLDLSRVEGVLRSPTTDSAKSDQSVQRAVDPAVAISRVTPAPAASGSAGASVTIGTPALSLSTSNAPGTTTSVISANSQIALFGTQAPIGVSTGGAVGTSAYAARADHVHGLTDGITVQLVRIGVDGVVGSTRPELNFIHGNSVALSLSDNAGANRADLTVGFSGTVPTGGTPALGFTVSNTQGNAPTFIRTNANLAIFDTTAPATLESDLAAAVGTAAFAARRDHRHQLNVVGSNTAENLGPSGLAGSGVLAARDDHTHKAQVDSADLYVSGTTRGMITKDVQATPHYWRIRVQGDTSVVTGGCTISISAGGVITGTRDAGASGTIVIRIDDFGTTAP